jgi:hypothetical protein
LEVFVLLAAVPDCIEAPSDFASLGGSCEETGRNWVPPEDMWAVVVAGSVWVSCLLVETARHDGAAGG